MPTVLYYIVKTRDVQFYAHPTVSTLSDYRQTHNANLFRLNYSNLFLDTIYYIMYFKLQCVYVTFLHGRWLALFTFIHSTKCIYTAMSLAYTFNLYGYKPNLKYFHYPAIFYVECEVLKWLIGQIYFHFKIYRITMIKKDKNNRNRINLS